MMLGSNEAQSRTKVVSAEFKLHWSEWLLISFAFLVLGSMILHTVVYSGL
jgi:hypothetical protein